jgi:hypothetical protein
LNMSSHGFCLIRSWAASLVLFASTAAGQVSIGSVQNYVVSNNLESVTLQGSVRLTSQGRDKLSRCGAYVFTLQDDTGSIEIAVRRPARMASLKNGDVVTVHAQIQVIPERHDPAPRICIQAIGIIPVHR